MENTLNPNVLMDVNADFVVIGTSEVCAWTEGKPFVVGLTTEEEFDANGCDYNTFKDMKIGEVRTDFDYEGIAIIRIR